VDLGVGAAKFPAFAAALGVRVRDRSALPGCEGCVRITAGPPAGTEQVISILEAWHATQSR
jgi:histidinol-phosphate/aromatic aminotransferase/cobyric acid decarboxylase-like protein